MIRIHNLKKYQLNSIIKITSNCYHSKSESGVYGYKPKSIEEFKVNEEVLKSRNSQSNVYRWVEAYRQYGHLIAKINPVDFGEQQTYIPELDITKYGLNKTEIFNANGILNNNDINNSNNNNTIEYARKYLESCYCGTTSMEINHIESIHEKEWLSENYEKYLNESINSDVQKEIATLLIKSQAWDNFMAVKFPTVKRYGGEGAESMLAFFRQIFNSSIDAEIDHIVLGMPHRGKLNLLTTMLKTPPAKIFKKFKGHPELPAEAKAMCDIASHFHVSETLNFNGKDIGFSLIHNPSHLEINNPVSMGKTRSKQQTSRDGAFSDDAAKPFSTSVLNLQLHGDAAFAGQGVNQEMLMMAGTPHFDVGGSIHMIVNNQVGFTTPSDRGRVSRYSSDLVKSVNVPIFHVNGDDPEALTKITKLAFAYQRKFRKDVFIDFNCYRRWGHNEVDDPTFTNPALYKIIHSRKSVPDLYTEKLINENILTNELVSDVVKSHMAFLNDELVNSETYQPDAYYFKKQWTGIEQASNAITYWDTGIDYNLLRYIGEQSVYFPSKFNVHPHLLKMHVNSRLKRIDDGMKIDWATAEAMAFGSLMYQGHNVRISGEDVGRGTFSQRHAMLIDQQTNEMWIPLNTLKGGLGGKLEVANSILSEEAVLAFEYGMAMDNPNNLIIWEAQFGDFFNGAQIVIDTYIASGETKWMMSNGLVMLLPHGYDGAASEHSSCRIERFLQQTDSKETQPDGDDINMQIVNPSTPAQYFHLLRRQMVRNYRKPLVVIAPKTVLRLSEATSTHNEFQPGTKFLPVIGDVIANPAQVKRVLLCSGKHYYNLNQERIEKRHEDVAIVRVESLCPFPVQEITNELDKYKNAKLFIWCQEEHRNMGAWTFIKPRFENMCARKIKYCGRYEGATPAVGVSIWHKAESDYVVQTPFKTN